MTFKTCPQCQKGMAPSAFACPHCGHISVFKRIVIAISWILVVIAACATIGSFYDQRKTIKQLRTTLDAVQGENELLSKPSSYDYGHDGPIGPIVVVEDEVSDTIGYY